MAWRRLSPRPRIVILRLAANLIAAAHAAEDAHRPPASQVLTVGEAQLAAAEGARPL